MPFVLLCVFCNILVASCLYNILFENLLFLFIFNTFAPENRRELSCDAEKHLLLVHFNLIDKELMTTGFYVFFINRYLL